MHVGVIGAGWWGTNIINTLDKLAMVRKVTVYDKRPDIGAKFIDNKKTTIAESVEGLLREPSIIAVCLATPPSTHYEYSKQVLFAGKHLLVEKPPAYNSLQVAEIGAIAAKNQLVYMLDALYLFLEPIKKIKQIIDTKAFSDPVYIQMFRIGDELRRTGSGIQRLRETMFKNGTDVIEDLFFHDASILFYLFGDFNFISVEKLCLYDPSLCDTAKIKLQARGIPVDLMLSWTLVGRRRGMIIYDKHKVLEYDALANENQISLFDLSTNSSENFNFPPAAPLTDLLSYFLHCSTGMKKNFIGSEFMERITTIWGQMSK